MLYNSTEDSTATDYFAFINDTIGFNALTMALVSIRFENSSFVASVLFSILLVFSFSKGKQYKKIAHRYLEQMRKRRALIQVFWNMKFYLLGMTTLFSVVIGALDEKFINSINVF